MARSCKGCPDRWVKGTKRCHDTCPDYAERAAALREARDREKAIRDVDRYAIEMTMKSKIKEMHYQKKRYQK